MSKSLPNWKCKLLASVDISGSTAFKAQQPREQRVHWVSRFQYFFENFPKVLAQCASEATESAHGLCDTSLISSWRVWKYVGDEILVWVDIQSHEEVCLHLHGLISAVEKYEEELKSGGAPTLGLKAAAWLVNFPLPNAEVTILQPDHGGGDFKVLDFLGPGIDLGFRLARFADSRRLPVSAGLAYLISRSSGQGELTKRLNLGYSGSEILKGVMDNRPYPIFWIDRNEDHQTKEDMLLHRLPRVDPIAASSFLDDFFDAEQDRVIPFIPNDHSPFWNRTPDKLIREWDAVQSDDILPQYRESIEHDGYAENAESMLEMTDQQITLPPDKH